MSERDDLLRDAEEVADTTPGVTVTEGSEDEPGQVRMDETSDTEQTPAGELASEPEPQPDYQDLYLRAMAETENVRKLMTRRQGEMVADANRALMRRLIPVLDHFNLAIEHGEGGAGIQLALKELMEALGAEGLSEIDVADGEEFDPTIHNALTTMPDPSVTRDTVRQVHRKGYLFRDQVLRAPEVVVAQAPQEG